MKSIALILCCSIFLSYDVPPAVKFSVKKGSVLTYEVKAGKDIYNFIITVNSALPDSSLEFSYTMGAPANKNGIVMISENALNTSHKLVNFFGGGEMKLEDATTIWISKQVFHEAIEAGGGFATDILFDNDKVATHFAMIVPDEEEYKINGKMMKIKTVQMTETKFNETTQELDYGKMVGVLDNSRNPLILFLSIGFEVQLKEAKNVVIEE